jgi:hypothetical protein
MPPAVPWIATWYDILVEPLLRDIYILIPGLLFWFLVQHGTDFLAHRLLGNYRKMTREEQLSWCARCVAVVNGIVCSPTAVLFVRGYYFHRIDDDVYLPIPENRFFHAMILSYFTWDCIVCVIGGWSWAFTIHAFCSFFGTYFLSYPISQRYSTFYTGCFEVSNGLYHASEMLTSVQAWPLLAIAMKGLFALMFIGVRIIGGMWISYIWTMRMWDQLQKGEAHSRFVLWAMMIMTVAIMSIQLLWLGEIYRGVRDVIFGPPAAAAGVSVEAKDDQKAVTAKRAKPSSPIVAARSTTTALERKQTAQSSSKARSSS